MTDFSAAPAKFSAAASVKTFSAAAARRVGSRRRFAPVKQANRCAGFTAPQARRALDRGEAAAENFLGAAEN